MKKSDFINPAYVPAFEKKLGTFIFRTSGDGHYLREQVTFAAEIVVQIGDKDSIERDINGTLEYVYGTFELHYFRPFAGPLPYTDRAVTAQLNQHLAHLGLDGKVDWSEAGRQSPFHGDFDADWRLFEQIIPEAF